MARFWLQSLLHILFVRDAAAYPPGRVHRAVPLNQKSDKLPSGSQWLHEIKHDGFRVTDSAFHRLALACGEAQPS